MEHVILKDFSVGCAGDSLKLLTGKILGCKAIIFLVWFYFEKQQCKNATFVLSRSLLCTHESRCLPLIALPKIMLFYSSYLWRVCVTPRAIGWTLLPVLNWEHCCFHFWGKRWKIFQRMKVQILASWEFPKNLTCVILLESSSVMMSLTTLESPSHTNWRVIHVPACLMINRIKEKQLR